ncbi:MAG TPA: methyltransferase domain-containing protein [Bradyrhizobium sp.]|nr:methyltransferase domain-containing protein [Bradyrhizobium sp.]
MAVQTAERHAEEDKAMNLRLLDILCDPVSKEPLGLTNEVLDADGRVLEGSLETPSGRHYRVKNGIPRFLPEAALSKSVESFGDEWNFFNFTQFKINWLTHTVRNTFGSVDTFKAKTIVDAGGGSGAQTLWMLEAGAEHVVMLELSDSVDDVVQRNLWPSGYRNYDVIQCSIDAPPLKPGSIDGIVYCHNVIQHTPSVEKTAAALFALVAPGGEFVFNCYPRNDRGVFRWIRFHLIYSPLRYILSRMPFKVTLAYARAMGVLRQVPGLGVFLEKSGFCVQGDVPRIDSEDAVSRLKRRYKTTVLNTFDGFGSHAFQHHKSDAEMRALVAELQPDSQKVMNLEKYFSRPASIGCALRIFR